MRITRERNKNFAAAFDYFKRKHGIISQRMLAQMIGVSEDTISRILKGRTDVSEDVITKFQTATGEIFNLQWLRGAEDCPMLVSDMHAQQEKEKPQKKAPESELIAAKNEVIAELRNRLADKDKLIAQLEARIEDLQYIINQSRPRLHPKPMVAAEIITKDGKQKVQFVSRPENVKP